MRALKLTEDARVADFLAGTLQPYVRSRCCCLRWPDRTMRRKRAKASTQRESYAKKEHGHGHGHGHRDRVNDRHRDTVHMHTPLHACIHSTSYTYTQHIYTYTYAYTNPYRFTGIYDCTYMASAHVCTQAQPGRTRFRLRAVTHLLPALGLLQVSAPCGARHGVGQSRTCRPLGRPGRLVPPPEEPLSFPTTTTYPLS